MIKTLFFEPRVAALPLVGYLTSPDFPAGGYLDLRVQKDVVGPAEDAETCAWLRQLAEELATKLGHSLPRDAVPCE